MAKQEGCAFGLVNREKIEEVRKCMDKVDLKLDDLGNRMTDLFNHQSSRLPTWATALIAFLSSLVTGLGVFFLTHKVV